MDQDRAAARNFKDFLTQYNKFTESCFGHCIANLNYRLLSQEEEACIDKCSSKLININHRMIGTYMELNPMNKNQFTEQDSPELKQLAAQVEDILDKTNQELSKNTEEGTTKIEAVAPVVNDPVAAEVEPHVAASSDQS
ncbi:mitochondrial import inner membrane translocase subunit Tim10 B-like [Saccoglossus kowalevskii]|uniref:Mitochondrial import inner membrane translocase subunit n=1 Tax=Saccoglossus kowalevskii TaxID=10224 RepID=A0ABM0GU25_SACKO|nr:PREDICTED: mitochondrial import inner membrane translocase subunit Tim10 B-like [Saccoglossus kowalevskii]